MTVRHKMPTRYLMCILLFCRNCLKMSRFFFVEIRFLFVEFVWNDDPSEDAIGHAFSRHGRLWIPLGALREI